MMMKALGLKVMMKIMFQVQVIEIIKKICHVPKPLKFENIQKSIKVDEY